MSKFLQPLFLCMYDATSPSWASSSTGAGCFSLAGSSSNVNKQSGSYECGPFVAGSSSSNPIDVEIVVSQERNVDEDWSAHSFVQG